MENGVGDGAATGSFGANRPVCEAGSAVNGLRFSGVTVSFELS